MKAKNIFIALIAVLSMTGCEKEYIAPNSFSDIGWYTSKGNAGEFVVNKGDFIGFMDVSQGEISHQWIIEEGTHFLKDGFEKGDSLEYFIDSSKGLSTTDKQISVLFSESGVKTVRLLQTFSDKVTLNSEIPVSAVKKGDEWVFDTIFTVDVYAPMMPAYKVYQLIEDDEGAVIEEAEILYISEADKPSSDNSGTWPTIDVEVGGRLKFVDLTTEDRPDKRTWTISNSSEGTVSNDSVVTIFFNELGYTTNKLGSLKSERTEDDITASATKLIPLKVNVVPSTKPLLFTGNLNESEDQSISFSVSGELNQFTDAESAFTVHVTNSKSGFDQNIEVSKAAVDPTDKTKVLLTLAAPIYSSDLITISYDNSVAPILSTDARELSSFEKQEVNMYNEICVDPQYFDFENAEGWFLQHPKQWFLTGEKASSGSTSLKFIFDSSSSGTSAKKAKTQSVAPNLLDLKEGSYRISMDVWVSEESEVKKVQTNLSNSFLVVDWDFTEVAKGSWQTITTEVTLVGHNKIVFQASKADILSDTATIYFDNMTFTKLEDRI